MTQEWMTLADLADWLVVPHRTVYSWRQRGEGPPAYKVGGKLRWRRSDVEDWLQAHRDDREAVR